MKTPRLAERLAYLIPTKVTIPHHACGRKMKERIFIYLFVNKKKDSFRIIW